MSLIIKKAIHIIKYLLIILVLLFLLIVGTVNLPVVHKAITKKTNAVLLEKGIPVHIGKITLLINGNIGVRKLAMILPPNDTIIYAENVSVDFHILPLFSKKIVVENAILNDALVNILTDSITGKLQIISAFNPSGEKPPKVEVVTTKQNEPWDINANKVLLKNIRFMYSNPAGGILVKQNLKRAKIDFDTFSILKKQIDVENLEIENPVGMVGIWKGIEKTEEVTGESLAWKFSLQNLKISDLLFTLNQPDAGQSIHVALKNGNISIEKLDLALQEILIRKIGLNKPEITFTRNDTLKDVAENEKSSTTFSIPEFPWTIISEKLTISDGILTYIDSINYKTNELEKWLPVHKLNATFNEVGLLPSGYNLNLEKLSFALANSIEIESGSLNFTSDSLQNIGLEMNLSALINEKKDWFSKKTNLSFNTKLSGNTTALQIGELAVQSSNGLQFNLNGTLQNPLQIPDSECDLTFSSGTISRNMLTPILFKFSPKTVLPQFRPFTIAGIIENELLDPVFSIKINSESGIVEATGHYDIRNISGVLQSSFTNVLLSELLGDDYPNNLTGKIKLQGALVSGDIPEGEVTLEIDSIRFKNKTTRNILLQAKTFNREAAITVKTADSAIHLDLAGQFAWDDKKAFSGKVNGIFDVDLFAMNLISKPFKGKGEIESNFNYHPENIIVSANLDNFIVSKNNKTATIEKTRFKLHATDSIIESNFDAGFISAVFSSRASFADFKNAFDSTQLHSIINLDSTSFLNMKAVSNLESFKFGATVRHTPFLNLFIPDSVLNFSDIIMNIYKTHKDSIAKGTVFSEWINYSKFKSFKTQLQASVEHDRFTIGVKTDSIVGEKITFGNTGIHFDIMPANITGNLFVSNKADSIIHKIGFEAGRINDLVIFKSATEDWVINKKNYTLSTREFLTWDRPSKTFSANLGLYSGEKQIEFRGTSADKLEFSIKNIELKNLAIPGIIGFVPDGILNGNVIYSAKKNNKLELNMEMHQIKWNNLSLHKLTANGYMIADSTGILESEIIVQADDSLSLEAQMVSNKTKKEFTINSKFKKLNFELFEPFISEYANNLHGTSSGEVIISSKADKIAMDGEIGFTDFGLKIIPLKVWLTIPNNKIELKNNQFLFNNFTVMDSLMRPLIVNGKVDFINSEDIKLDLNVEADKILLMNTPISDKIPLYGSIVVNSGLTIGGSIYSPTIKGNIELENGTNLTYQLIQDLSVKGSQNEVVFATITDSLQIIYPESEKVSQPIKMPMIETTISINPKSIFNIKIADLYNVDIKISGNGRLDYNMLPNNTMSLNGDYQINTGECKLKITGWPLKHFNITPGSSFSWNGDIENPALNLEATSKVKGSYVNPIDNKSRLVDFVVSMKLKNQLSKLDIIFGIQSPDQYITSVLSSLSSDEMMRQSVNLLLFETIDIPGVESSSNYLSSQINSFWESQLNSLTSAKLNKTKLSFGIDTYNQSTTTGGQEEKTSFTYEMERKFMNDRATFKVSGKINDYNEGAYQTNSLFENFIFEYALDSLNTKNLKLYQKRDYEDMLEGEVTKYGIGFLYRKNYKKLNEIWRRGKKSNPDKQKNTN